MLPPMARTYSAADTIPVRHLHQSIGKSKKPIVVVRWTPEGRRLLTGGHTGEFMLWNGTAFNFETVMDVRETTKQTAGMTFESEKLIVVTTGALRPSSGWRHIYRLVS
jgi:polyadenylation factor subunit 2